MKANWKSFFKSAWKVIAAVAGLAALMIWAGGCLGEKIEPNKLEAEAGSPLPSSAKTTRVRELEMRPVVEVMGTVASEENIHLSARLSAYVRAVHAGAGDRVAKGDLLLELDDREVRQQLSAAEAQLAQAEKEFNRTRGLFETGAATDQALTQAESAYRRAKAEVERTKVMLTYTEISAPIDGIVIERLVEAGDLAAPGQVLFRVYDPARMRLEAPVPVRLIDSLAVGKIVPVTLERPRDIELQGEVNSVINEIDPTSRTQLVKVRLPDPGMELLPGAFGRLKLRDNARRVLLIPPEAVTRIGQLEIVRLKDGDRMIRRLVKTGRLHEEGLEVLSGLEAGDELVLVGNGEEA